MRTSVNLVWYTKDGDFLIGKMARVSNPGNQDNPNVAGLIKYCIEHKHWSIFEMANMCVEINTSRAISHQIVRHRSFSFQEFSQRYAKAQDFYTPSPRRQDKKNRQNSIDDLPDHIHAWWYEELDELLEKANNLYREALLAGVAKECARFVLPECAMTKLYMNGTVRSWIHYLELRSVQAGAQREHIDVADLVRPLFAQCFPTVYKALGWE